MLRIPIIDPDKCKPKKCAKECKKKCPVNLMGKQCIEIEDIAKINNLLCVGCGMCQKVCPFSAVKIVNIPTQIANNLVHSYGENLFKLYKLPNPKVGNVIGILGPNGVGKTTIMNILGGKILPNFYVNNDDGVEISQDQVLRNVRGTELQKYLKLLYTQNLKINTKPQDVISLVKNKTQKVRDVMGKLKDTENYERVMRELDMEKIMDNVVSMLSGGELQKLICMITLLRPGDVYIFDEPSNYLDIEYRIKVANLIKELSGHDKYIFVVEHDLTTLDYVADFVHIMFGDPGAYGCVSTLYPTSDGINMYFDGYSVADNIKFRDVAFKLNDLADDVPVDNFKNSAGYVGYEEKIVEFDTFNLKIKKEVIPLSTNMIVILGKNGTGKSTYLKFLTKLGYIVSYKPQINNIMCDHKMSVQDLLYSKISKSMGNPQFISDVVNPLGINKLYGKKVRKLSGGELQKVLIVVCLGTSADVFLIDEPSSSLDIEQRFLAIKVIKKFLLQNKKIGFIVEHDIMLATSLAKEQTSKIIVCEEVWIKDGVRYCETSGLLDFNEGINRFLKSIDVTFRSDRGNNRPKINKLGSIMDVEQKMKGKYWSQ